MSAVTPRVTIKYRPDEPVYIEIWTADQIVVAGWVHEEPWPCYIEDEEDTEEDEDDDSESPWRPVILTPEPIVDPPLHNGGRLIKAADDDSEVADE